MKNQQKNKNFLPIPAIVAGLAIVFLVLLWEYLGSLGGQIGLILPPPSKFLAILYNNNFKVGIGAQSTSLYLAILATITRLLLGLLIAFVAALLTGVIFKSLPVIRWALSPVIYCLAPIAPIAWIPLAIVLFGIGNETSIFIVFMGVYFILSIATFNEIEQVPNEYLIVAKNHNATKRQLWLYVIFPAILPNLFHLLRINLMTAWMAVLVAEMVGISNGIGAIIMMGRNLFDNELVMLGVFTIGIIGFSLDFLLKTIEKYILWWQV